MEGPEDSPLTYNYRARTYYLSMDEQLKVPMISFFGIVTTSWESTRFQLAPGKWFADRFDIHWHRALDSIIIPLTHRYLLQQVGTCNTPRTYIANDLPSKKNAYVSRSAILKASVSSFAARYSVLHAKQWLITCSRAVRLPVNTCNPPIIEPPWSLWQGI